MVQMRISGSRQEALLLVQLSSSPYNKVCGSDLLAQEVPSDSAGEIDNRLANE
jgi:hypothetical protein